ncbi:MAG TPA: bifunctional methylenetetrahydrofolate dehydrogenase/methenyltetrahydrofolate cyclohydrolase FolD [Xanthobacteraceae bacterium]|jgi:methylenetetrahydrofolate dehydrogenase (NADP+)/methenyltetrahydrofolate cyclohydrolase|nr:bifunctional methylenetetrahydrofolate dehydrogenase/methenyltetrahydrofolate cyclohydrolase FolD [Xanthobacteraceae bacterium]
MSAQIIDGKGFAARLRNNIAGQVQRLTAEQDVVPGLAVILVGEDPASTVYVRNKANAATAAGIRSLERRLPVDTSQQDVLALIDKLNGDPTVHGILVQMPLPAQIDSAAVIAAIDPAKDVDGFHPLNVGQLATGLPAPLVPCTPQGCILLAKSIAKSLAGQDAVVIGRSNIVGKPLAQLLINESATVTVAHSKTRDLPEICRRADLLCVAAGRPGMVRGSWIKPGATVLDIGINRIVGADGKAHLVGDVAFAEALQVAGAVTPVPGGIGPMTVACLLLNTIRAACAIHRLPEPMIAPAMLG